MPSFSHTVQVWEDNKLKIHCFVRFMLIISFKKFKRKENMASFTQLCPNLNNELDYEV